MERGNVMWEVILQLVVVVKKKKVKDGRKKKMVVYIFTCSGTVVVGPGLYVYEEGVVDERTHFLSFRRLPWFFSSDPIIQIGIPTGVNCRML